MKRLSSLLLLLLFSAIVARPPAKLPGEELSNETYLNYMINNSLTEQELEQLSKETSLTQEVVVDTNKLFQTWSAPSIADQIAKDTGSIKLGMGAVFVPRMSEDGAIEPDLLIKDENGKTLHAGQTGTKFNLLPGWYTLHIGNLAKLEITKEVYIEEGKITPVIPDWCALRIEVIDENAKPISGEYDLASLSPLEPIGRGRGRDIDLAEDIRIWFLPVGTYKIIGPGSSLNSISNFLTVRLNTPGEFVRYSVVQDDNDNKILGGGILIEDAEIRKNKKWTHNINIGGSVDLNFVNNRDSLSSDSTQTILSLLLYDRFNMKRNKLEINNLIKVDMSLTMDEFQLRSLRSSVDELRISTLFTYRLFPRLGPYARGEYVSAILPKNVDASTVNESDAKTVNEDHVFIAYNEIVDTINDGTNVTYDFTSNSWRLSPPISPITLQAGTGINFQILRNRIINSRLLTGFGIKYENQWDTWQVVPEEYLPLNTDSEIYKNFYSDSANIEVTSILNTSYDAFNSGPEMVLNNNLYLGRFISVDNEIKLFFPFDRMDKPDLEIRNLLSFHLTGNVIIDYDYRYDLIQGEEFQKDVGRHRILLRISFSR